MRGVNDSSAAWPSTTLDSLWPARPFTRSAASESAKESLAGSLKAKLLASSFGRATARTTAAALIGAVVLSGPAPVRATSWSRGGGDALGAGPLAIGAGLTVQKGLNRVGCAAVDPHARRLVSVHRPARRHPAGS